MGKHSLRRSKLTHALFGQISRDTAKSLRPSGSCPLPFRMIAPCEFPGPIFPVTLVSLVQVLWYLKLRKLSCITSSSSFPCPGHHPLPPCRHPGQPLPGSLKGKNNGKRKQGPKTNMSCSRRFERWLCSSMCDLHSSKLERLAVQPPKRPREYIAGPNRPSKYRYINIDVT